MIFSEKYCKLHNFRTWQWEDLSQFIFENTWHKISNAPGDVNILNTSTFKTSNAPGDVRTNILKKLRNKCKTKTIFGQQTKEAHQHISFKSSTQQLEANFNNISTRKSTMLHISYTHSSRTKHRENGLKPDQVNFN